MSETKLTERQQKILNLVKESPTITGKQMSETLSVSQRTIERDLSALQKMGILKREGKDNDGMWVFVKNNVNSQFSIKYEGLLLMTHSDRVMYVIVSLDFL